MNFLYHSSFGAVDQTDAYERLLLDAMLGDRTLFTRADEVEQGVDLGRGHPRRLATSAQ